jgi:hypothetical protein
MRDGFVTTTIGFAAALAYIFGWESLVRIEDNEDRTQRFHFDIPSLDAEEFRKEFEGGELNISDAKSLIENFSHIARTVKEMRKRNEASWCSRSWVNGRGR